MPRLYIANCTPQDREFSYRLLGTTQVSKTPIPRGEQRVSGPDMAREQINDVIGQNEQYGLCAASEVNQARDYVNMLWNLDKPVSAAQMKQALDRNLFLKEEEGKRLRQTVAVGVTEIAQRENPDNYTGMRVALKDARRDVDLDLNEIHTHRRDGQYERGTDFEAPLAPRKSRLRRRAA